MAASRTFVGGSSLVANGGALAQVARFTADGNGGVNCHISRSE